MKRSKRRNMCSQCKGKGKVSFWMGVRPASIGVTCSLCNGSGKALSNTACTGQGGTRPDNSDPGIEPQSLNNPKIQSPQRTGCPVCKESLDKDGWCVRCGEYPFEIASR